MCTEFDTGRLWVVQAAHRLTPHTTYTQHMTLTLLQSTHCYPLLTLSLLSTAKTVAVKSLLTLCKLYAFFFILTMMALTFIILHLCKAIHWSVDYIHTFLAEYCCSELPEWSDEYRSLVRPTDTPSPWYGYAHLYTVAAFAYSTCVSLTQPQTPHIPGLRMLASLTYPATRQPSRQYIPSKKRRTLVYS